MDYSDKLYLLCFPLIGALIGWFTNYLAVRMLFRPHRPVKIGPFKLQGLIPKRRRDVAANIAKTVEEELLSKDDITRILQQNIDWEEKVEEKIDVIVEKNLHINFWEKMPLWSHFRDKIALPLKGFLRIEIAKLLHGFHSELVIKFRNNLDLHKLVFERIDRFDLLQLERVVLQVAAKELRHIELIGALLGFIIGIVQAVLVLTVGGA